MAASAASREESEENLEATRARASGAMSEKARAAA